MINKYKKNPIEITAVRYIFDNKSEIESFIGKGELVLVLPNKEIEIPTLEGTIRASIGDYIIRGVKGEFYPCKPDIFKATYTEVL